METLRVLVVEPALEARLQLAAWLEEGGYSTATAQSGAEALETVRSGAFSLVVLGAALPDGGTLDTLRSLRQTSDLPVLLVGNGLATPEIVAALEAGADDVVGQPLVPEEFLGRLRAILRRVTRPAELALPLALPTLQIGPLQVDFSAQVAMLGGRDLNLSGKELHLLYLLAQHVGQLLSRAHIFHEVWGGDVVEDSKTLDVHVSRLRKKLDDAGGHGALLKTIRNQGYMLSTEVESLQP